MDTILYLACYSEIWLPCRLEFLETFRILYLAYKSCLVGPGEIKFPNGYAALLGRNYFRTFKNKASFVFYSDTFWLAGDRILDRLECHGDVLA